MHSAYYSTLNYLYNAAPLFQNIGAGAYKEGLANTRALDEHFGHPHRQYRTIHVAGTNGKGSVSSTLAAVLQSAGLKVGLYTSPHLVDFRERIRVNGEMIPEERVIDFVAQERAFFEPLYPSFFELTTALAFLYFAEQQVDVAVIEVGLGGRLDCTNIITPDLSIITNISFDHQQLLGNTLPQIAAEKAGIIKAGVPVVVGEVHPLPAPHVKGKDVTEPEVRGNGVRDVFVRVFEEKNANLDNKPALRFADEEADVTTSPLTGVGAEMESEREAWSTFELRGSYQQANLQTVLCALSELRKQPFYANVLTEEAIHEGLTHVMALTGLRGRWQQLQEHPTLVCDAGHNIAGIQYVVRQLKEQQCSHLHIVFGMVNDKDYTEAVRLLAELQDRATFYFTQPSCKRALPADELANTYGRVDQHVYTYPLVRQAVEAALSAATVDDFVFVGGSCYVVADLLEAWPAICNHFGTPFAKEGFVKQQ